MDTRDRAPTVGDSEAIAEQTIAHAQRQHLPTEIATVLVAPLLIKKFNLLYWCHSNLRSTFYDYH